MGLRRFDNFVITQGLFDRDEENRYMNGTTFQLVISRPGQPTYDIPLGTEALHSLAMAVTDEPANADLIDALAMHPAGMIRAVFASYECIRTASIERLEVDPSVEVRRALAQSDAFHRAVSTERLCAFAATDTDLAVTVAGDLGSFTEIDLAAVAEHLAVHSDPAVRIALAGCPATPHPLRRRLTRDTDADVAQTARNAQRR